MIRTLTHSIGRIRLGGATLIATVRRGAVVVWQSARACFSGPAWRYDRPWSYKEKWSYGKKKR